MAGGEACDNKKNKKWNKFHDSWIGTEGPNELDWIQIFVLVNKLSNVGWTLWITTTYNFSKHFCVMKFGPEILQNYSVAL